MNPIIAQFPLAAAVVCLLCVVALVVLLYLHAAEAAGKEIDEDRS